MLRNQTLLYFIPQDCLRTSRNMQLIFLFSQALSSMRTMMLCALYGEMTTASAAVYLPLRPVKKCSSSVLVQTLQNAFFMRSTVVWMRRLNSRFGPNYQPITSEYLDYDEVVAKYDKMMDWLAHLYVGTLNMIHYMHDKYYYEAAEMALIDTKVDRSFATGIAGFSHVVDSLSAIKYAKVKAIRDEDGITTDFQVEGDFPRYGNDDDRADEIATTLLSTFLEKLKHIHTYRDSKPTTSILTITSNVVYGKATGSLPDGRKAGEPLAPGANPSYGAEQNGLLASLNSVAKLDYEDALDGISNTQTINPDALGHTEEERTENLVHVLDGYFDQGAHHLNVNVFGKEKLIDAMEHPEKEEYANFTIRVSGYAVKFIDLTREQQLDVIARTCHDRM